MPSCKCVLVKEINSSLFHNNVFIHLFTTQHAAICTNMPLSSVSVVTAHSFPTKERESVYPTSSTVTHSTILNSCNTSTLRMTHHPTYWSTWNAGVANSQCRRKQYDSSTQSLQAAYTTSQPRQAPPNSCAGWVILTPATFVLAVLKWRACLN